MPGGPIGGKTGSPAAPAIRYAAIAIAASVGPRSRPANTTTHGCRATGTGALGERLCRERLVRLDEPVLRDALSLCLHEIPHGGNRRQEEILRAHRAGRVGTHTPEHWQAVGRGIRLRRHHERGGPVVERARVAG